MKKCKHCNNTARLNEDYCGACLQEVENSNYNNQVVEIAKKELSVFVNQLTDCSSPNRLVLLIENLIEAKIQELK